MEIRVSRLRWENHQIVGCVISFIAINMMDDFPWHQRSAEHFLRYGSMLMPAIQFSVRNAFARVQLCFPQHFTGGCGHPVGIHLKIQLCHVF